MFLNNKDEIMDQIHKQEAKNQNAIFERVGLNKINQDLGHVDMFDNHNDNSESSSCQEEPFTL